MSLLLGLGACYLLAVMLDKYPSKEEDKFKAARGAGAALEARCKAWKYGSGPHPIYG